HFGFALSTTHVATGSILGSGVGRPGALVRWAVAGRMAAAWLITLPSAAIVGALMWWIGHLIGGLAGATAIFLLLCALATALWLHARRTPVDHRNVNDDWDAEARTPVGAAS
ncbi:MAG: inorganic phosphate transporter, PiT family, partial [Cryptosporangiaceae bacterium]|nr:inorganic phosphate transporter, PiT family [Cryptosporangiaceae bacterium]